MTDGKGPGDSGGAPSLPVIPDDHVWRRGEDWLLMHPIAPGWELAVGAYSVRRRKSLDRIVGDQDTREALLSVPLRPDRICAVVMEGAVVGCLSYRMDGAGSLRPQFARYRARFGLVGGALRYGMTLATLYRGRSKDLYIEGFAVAPETRGRGLGKALLEWLSAEVLRHGKAGWRTEMPEGHEAAARAYQRFGAREERRVWLGPVGRLLGSRYMTLWRWTPPET
ncbi:MAG: GNAT family N-acetyltransferase [Pseudomonadota bacterium]